jgi:hypothetical protein
MSAYSPYKGLGHYSGFDSSFFGAFLASFLPPFFANYASSSFLFLSSSFFF